MSGRFLALALSLVLSLPAVPAAAEPPSRARAVSESSGNPDRPAASVVRSPTMASDLVAWIGGAAARGFEASRAWIGRSYQRSPAVTLALGVLVLLPTLALAGLLSGWQRRWAIRRKAAGTVLAGSVTELLGRPGGDQGGDGRLGAHVELIGLSPRRFAIGHGLLRIGREDDNDLCLAEDRVQRYHALITHTDEEYLLRDVSGPDSIGVVVNGRRVAVARLASGDLIEIGAAKVRFAHAG